MLMTVDETRHHYFSSRVQGVLSPVPPGLRESANSQNPVITHGDESGFVNRESLVHGDDGSTTDQQVDRFAGFLWSRGPTGNKQ